MTPQQSTFPYVVSTIVPAMNEEGNIDEFCRQFAAMLEKAPFKGELVFVDDGSSDNTLARIKENAARYPWIRFASHQRNRGLTDALQTGFETASGEVFVFYPADLQYLPSEIPILVEPIAAGHDICTGWKQGKYDKRFVSSVYNWISRKIFNLTVHDLNSVKAFRREILDNIFLRRDWHRYLVVLAATEGYKITERKVTLHERNWGKTKFSLWRIPVGVLDMLAVKFQLTFLRKPLLFFGVAGAILLFVALLVGLWAMYQRFFQNDGDRAYLYLVILLTLVGMSLFLLGFVTEGQTAIKEEMGDLRKKTSKILAQLNKEAKT